MGFPLAVDNWHARRLVCVGASPEMGDPMNSAEVLRRLYKEKKEWKRTPKDSEARWTARGIDICIKHVYSIVREQRANARIRTPTINRWHARDLFKAVQSALHYLKLYDKNRAISVLEKAAEQALHV